MNLRVQKKEEKLRRIEQAARKLFAQHGFHGTKTRDLAKQAGIGAGTLFVYFPKKRALLVHLFVNDVSQVWREALATLDAEAPLVDALMHLFDALYDHYEKDRRLTRVFVQELLFRDVGDPDDRLAAMSLDFMNELGRLVERAVARNEIASEIAAPEAAYHFFSAYCFNLIGWVGGSMPAPHHRWLLRRALTILVSGMQGGTA